VLWLLSNPWHEKQEECNKVFQNSSKNITRSLYEKTNKLQMYDDRMKHETKRVKKEPATVTSISRYTTVPFAIFEKYDNQSEIETNKIKLALKKCTDTPIIQHNQGYMFVSIIVLFLYSRKYRL